MAMKRQLKRTCVLGVGWVLLGGQPSYADDLSPVSTVPTPPPVISSSYVDALISETGIVESNPLMLTSGAKTLMGSVTSPELIVNDSTPLTQLNLDTLLNENLFDQSEFNSTDVHEHLMLNTQNERWMAGIDQKTDYDTTRTSEPTAYNISTVPVRHFGETLTPSMSFSPNSDDKYSLTGAALISQYQSSIYSNYEVASLTPTYSHNFDPRNTGTFSIQAQSYKTTTGLSNTVDNIGPSIGWIATLTPRITAKGSVGVQETRQFSEGLAAQPWTLDYVYSVDVNFKGEEDTADFLSSRSEYPFGDGTEALLTSVSLTETHALNSRFSLNLSAGYESGSYQVSTAGSLQSYWSGSGGITYHALEHLDAVVNYEYRYENLTNVSGNAQDHLITFGLVYHPQAWAL
jgi:hypothetical protein